MKEIALQKLTAFIQQSVAPNAREWEDFYSILTYQEVDKNERLVKSGTLCNKLYFLSEGFVKYELNYMNKKQVVHVAGNGVLVSDFFSYYSNYRAISDIYTVSACKLLCVLKNDLERLYQENKVWSNFGRKIAENAVVNQIMDRITNQTLSAEERYLSILQSNPELMKVVKLGDLAEVLGITQETLSRIRKRLK